MAGAFDPYYTWLGIHPDEQPPTHYRLLGIRAFEENPEVIENAADRQMSHVRTFQTGKHSVESQTILNEVAVAKLCLLQAAKKAEYDKALKARLAAAQKAAAPPPTPAAPVQAVAPAAAKIVQMPVPAPTSARAQPLNPAPTHARLDFDPEDLTQIKAIQQPRAKTRKSKKATNPPPLLIGGGVAALVLVVGLAMWALGGSRQERAQSPAPASSQSGVVVVSSDTELSEAELKLDGNPLTLPESGRLTLPHGKHRLEASRPRFKSIDQPFELQLGGEEKIELAWKPEATLVLDWPRAERSDTTFALDGKRLDLDKSALEQTDRKVSLALAAGRHTVKISRSGFKDYEAEFVLAEDQEYRRTPAWEDPREGLLRKIDLKRDVVAGQWQFIDNNLVSPGGAATARIMIPESLPTAYSLTIVAHRPKGSKGPQSLPHIGLCARGTQFIISGEKDTLGIGWLDGRPWAKNEAIVACPLPKGDQEIKMTCIVRSSGVRVLLGGKQVFDWKGDYKRLTVANHWAVPRKDVVFIGSQRKFVISKLELSAVIDEAPQSTANVAVVAPQVGARPAFSPVEIPKRASVPSAAEQEAAAKQIDGLYSPAAAKSAVERLALAKKLSETAAGEAATSTNRFVLLKKAAELANSAGEAGTALAALDSLAKDFEFEPGSELEKLRAGFGDAVNDVAKIKQLVSDTDKVITAAAADGRHDVAYALASAVKQLTLKKPNAKDVRKQAAARFKDVETLYKSWKSFQDELVTTDGADLLALVDPDKHRVAGAWSKSGAELLVNGPIEGARLQLPVMLEGSYDLAVEFTRTGGDKSVALILPASHQMCGLIIGGAGGQASYLETIDRQGFGNSSTRQPAAITNRKRYKAEVRVRQHNGLTSIETRLDGVPYVQWRGNISSLDLPLSWHLPRPGLGLGSWGNDVTFHSARLKMVSGRAYPPSASLPPATTAEPSATLPKLASGFDSRREPARSALIAMYGGNEKTESAVAAGLDWLVRHQNPDGSWNLGPLYRRQCKDTTCTAPGQTQSDAAATALALLPLLAADDKSHAAAVRKGLSWLATHQKRNGDLSAGAEQQMYSHGLATIAMCEGYGMTRDPKFGRAAQLAIKSIEAVQNKTTGGWRYKPGETGDTSVVGWQYSAIKAAQNAGLNVRKETIEGVRVYLRLAAQRKGCMFSYLPGKGAPAPAVTAIGMLCKQQLGDVTRGDPALQEGLDYLMDNRPRLNVRDCYYWYYGTSVVRNCGGNEWKNWNQNMQDLVLPYQATEGCAAGSWSPDAPTKDRWAKEGGRLFLTSLTCLTLQSYYRSPPPAGFLPPEADKAKP